jgi:hypothetical protein
MSEKIDLKKTLKIFYQPTTQTPSIVEVPPFNFLIRTYARDILTEGDFNC